MNNTTNAPERLSCIRFVRPRVSWQCAVTKEETSGELIGIEHPDGKRGLCLNGRGWLQYIAIDKIHRLDATPWPND